MSATFPINEETGKVYTHVRLSTEKTSTFHHDSIILNKTVTIAEADSIARDADAIDELEWHKIISNPHVQSGLRRLAAEARRQIVAKETEEGGFAME